MRARLVVRLAAWLEILVGASFVVALEAQSRFLFGAATEGTGSLFARFSGVALIGLGIACLLAESNGTARSAVRGLFVFNVGATAFFAWVAVATAFRGFGLWPVVALHAALAIALGWQLPLDLKEGRR